MATTLTRGQLGKLPPRVDPRTLRLAQYVDRTVLPAPPPELDLGAAVPDWPMYANDRIGDCTTAAAGHMIEAWCEAAAGHAVEVADTDVLDAFEAVKIVDPMTGEEGAVELDVLRFWRRHGIGGHRIAAFADVAPADHDLVRTGTWLFGGLYIGLQLPSGRATSSSGTGPGSLAGLDAPGSWGGHAVNVIAYDGAGLTVVTWGALQRMTWSFWERYCDEAWAIISPDFLAGGRSPAGFDLPALQHDLALVSGGEG